MPGKQLGRVYVKDVDEVQCPICKNWYKSIAGQHLRIKHNMTIEEFKEEYPLYQYMSMDLLKKHSEIAIKNKISLSSFTACSSCFFLKIAIRVSNPGG